MNEHDESEFEDPGLKEAVRRTVGREVAPPSLHAKVKSTLAAEAAGVAAAAGEPSNGHGGGGTARRPRRGTSPVGHRPQLLAHGRHRRLRADRAGVHGLSASRVVLPAEAVRRRGRRRHHRDPGIVHPADDAHARRLRETPGPSQDPRRQPGSAEGKLAAGAGVTASTISLGGDWKFKGAGVCQVGESKAAHLLFVRADEFVSIFSLAAPEDCGYGSDSYRDMFEKHPVAGFRRGDALYCVVGSKGSGEMSREQVDPVLKQVETSVASGCLSHDTIVAVAAARRVGGSFTSLSASRAASPLHCDRLAFPSHDAVAAALS